MKNILIGICGGIAAYKATNIVSAFRKLGYNVKVIMTENAQKIITPLAFEALSKNKVITDMWESNTNIDVEHISVSDWADIVLIVPATYNIIGKIANGIADDMLSTVISATKKPVFFALAMNEKMYLNPILKENIQKLKKYNYSFIEADEGFLACNVNSIGRLKNENEIVNIIVNFLNDENRKPLLNKNILITAGPTREPLDPIRFFSNNSTGKMGYSLAIEATKMGANVTIISGPVNLANPEGINVIKVQTAQEMYEKVMENHQKQDIIIATAAVADYRPEIVYDKKIKKGDNFTVNFVRNKDILFELGKIKKDNLLIGFAAESENLIQNAKNKLLKKNLDMIVANFVDNFGSNENEITIIGKNFEKSFEKLDKEIVARKILETILERFFECD